MQRVQGGPLRSWALVLREPLRARWRQCRRARRAKQLVCRLAAHHLLVRVPLLRATRASHHPPWGLAGAARRREPARGPPRRDRRARQGGLMDVRNVLALRGPNVWAPFPVLEAWIDLCPPQDCVAGEPSCPDGGIRNG